MYNYHKYQREQQKKRKEQMDALLEQINKPKKQERSIKLAANFRKRVLSFVSEMEKNPVRINNEMLVNETVNQDYRYLQNKNIEKELQYKEKFHRYEKKKFLEQSLGRQRHVSKIDQRAETLFDLTSDEADPQKRFGSYKKGNARDQMGRVAATR